MMCRMVVIVRRQFPIGWWWIDHRLQRNVSTGTGSTGTTVLLRILVLRSSSSGRILDRFISGSRRWIASIGRSTAGTGLMKMGVFLALDGTRMVVVVVVMVTVEF